MTCVHLLSLQSCPTLCLPKDCSPLGLSVHGILQARILEWVAMSSSRGSSLSRDWTLISYVSCTGRWVLYHYRHLGSLRSKWQGVKCMRFPGGTVLVEKSVERPRVGRNWARELLWPRGRRWGGQWGQVGFPGILGRESECQSPRDGEAPDAVQGNHRLWTQRAHVRGPEPHLCCPCSVLLLHAWALGRCWERQQWVGAPASRGSQPGKGRQRRERQWPPGVESPGVEMSPGLWEPESRRLIQEDFLEEVAPHWIPGDEGLARQTQAVGREHSRQWKEPGAWKQGSPNENGTSAE